LGSVNGTLLVNVGVDKLVLQLAYLFLLVSDNTLVLGVRLLLLSNLLLSAVQECCLVPMVFFYLGEVGIKIAEV
jgi:hypothetical protein